MGIGTLDRYIKRMVTLKSNAAGCMGGIYKCDCISYIVFEVSGSPVMLIGQQATPH